MPDINYKILAHFLKLMSYDLDNWKKLVMEFRKNRLHTILEETDKHLCGEKEDILKEVEENLGPDHAPVIMKLLKAQQPRPDEMNKKIPEAEPLSPRKSQAIKILELKMEIAK